MGSSRSVDTVGRPVQLLRRPPAATLSAAAACDEALKLELQQAHAEHFGVYGARKLWRPLQRQGTLVARCPVERLMRELGLAGVVRGHHRSTVSDEVSPRRADLVERDFRAAVPNRLWVADLTYLANLVRLRLRGLHHHSDRGVQYLSIRYTERLAEAGVATSVGSRGDSYDSALAESVIGLYKTEPVHCCGPWRGRDDLELATLQWVDWFN